MQQFLAEEIMGSVATEPVNIQGLVVPPWRANLHPTAGLLGGYAKYRYLVTVGQDWTLEDLKTAVEKGPNVSELAPDAINELQVEIKEKEKQGFVR